MCILFKMIVSFITRSCRISMMRGRYNKQDNTGNVLRLFHAKVCGSISKMFVDIEAITNLHEINEMIHVLCHSQQHRSR